MLICRAFLYNPEDPHIGGFDGPVDLILWTLFFPRCRRQVRWQLEVTATSASFLVFNFHGKVVHLISAPFSRSIIPSRVLGKWCARLPQRRPTAITSLEIEGVRRRVPRCSVKTPHPLKLHATNSFSLPVHLKEDDFDAIGGSRRSSRVWCKKQWPRMISHARSAGKWNQSCHDKAPLYSPYNIPVWSQLHCHDASNAS